MRSSVRLTSLAESRFCAASMSCLICRACSSAAWRACVFDCMRFLLGNEDPSFRFEHFDMSLDLGLGFGDG